MAAVEMKVRQWTTEETREFQGAPKAWEKYHPLLPLERGNIIQKAGIPSS